MSLGSLTFTTEMAIQVVAQSSLLAVRKRAEGEYIILHKWNEATPYATHFVSVKSGQPALMWGHYFQGDQIDEAWDDFRTR